MKFTISLKVIFSSGFELLKKDFFFKFQLNFTSKKEYLFLIFYFNFIWWASLLPNFWYDPSGIYLSESIVVLHQQGIKKPQ